MCFGKRASVLVVFLPQVLLAEPQGLTVFELVHGIGGANNSSEARGAVEEFIREVVRSDLSSDRPSFCPHSGMGSIDALKFQRYALKQVPSERDQLRMNAGPVVLQYLARELPCS